jgi:glycosyltransferase involved in cell wall biosynthesis
MSAPSLTAIVIARNEEQMIGACLAGCQVAVARALADGLISRAEIVLVDSGSTDRTREIASKLGARVLAIPPSWPLSAAAGRYVGLLHTSSDLVLFVDGDFIIDPAWLPVGLGILGDSAIAAVCGMELESLQGTTAISRYQRALLNRVAPREDIVDTQAVAVGLFHRSWIERAGGVQPFLKGAEDRDIAIRMRMLGGRIVKTRQPMGIHHWSPGEDLNLLEYFRSVAKWSFGEGQAARFAKTDLPVRGVYFSRYLTLRHVLQLWIGTVAFAAGVAATAGVVLLEPLLIIAPAALGALLLGWTMRRNAERPSDTIFRLHAAPYAFVRLATFALGYLRPPRPAEEYPTRLPPTE